MDTEVDNKIIQKVYSGVATGRAAGLKILLEIELVLLIGANDK